MKTKEDHWSTWWEKTKKERSGFRSGTREYREAFFGGWYSRQAEIDELELVIKSAVNCLKNLQGYKRDVRTSYYVDGALDWLEGPKNL